MNILIVRVSSLGDVVHTLPAVSLLQQTLPNANIHWIVQKKAVELVRLYTGLAKVWELPDNYLHPKNWHTTYTILSALRKYQWDAIIDFQGLFKTTIITTQLKGPIFGFNYHHARTPITSLLSSHTTTASYTNIIQKNLTLASFVSTYLMPQQHSPTLAALTNPALFSYPDDALQTVNNWFIENNIRNPLLISPNTTWESKHWPLEHWKSFLTLLSHCAQSTNAFTPILIGSAFGAQGAALAEYSTTHKLTVQILPPWSLSCVAYLISKARLLIAPDTGLLHLADILNRQTIGIFGPTLAQKHGPFLQMDNVNNNIQIPCPHRYAKKHTKNTNTGQSTLCMYTLTPEELMQRVTYNLTLHDHNK